MTRLINTIYHIYLSGEDEGVRKPLFFFLSRSYNRKDLHQILFLCAPISEMDVLNPTDISVKCKLINSGQPLADFSRTILNENIGDNHLKYPFLTRFVADEHTKRSINTLTPQFRILAWICLVKHCSSEQIKSINEPDTEEAKFLSCLSTETQCQHLCDT